MSNKIVVPALGESITEATIAKWLKQIGDEVTADEPLVELETDKVNVEVPSPTSGRLSEILVNEGQTVQVGTLLGKVGESSQNKTQEPSPKNIKQKEQTDSSVLKPIKEKTKKNQNQLIDEPKVKDSEDEEILILNKPIKKVENIKNYPQEDEKILILNTPAPEDQNIKEIEKQNVLSPAVRRIVKEKKIDISDIEGTGKDGRITKSDLLNMMGNVPQKSERKLNYGPEEIVQMSTLRATIAKRLKQAQDNAAILTTFNEVDMFEVIEMKKNYKEDFEKKYLVKLGFMSFFVKACVVALKNFPVLNAEIDGNKIVYKNYYNISFAVGTEKGLVVPVLKNADELSFADIEKNISNLANKVKNGKITIEDLQGGTFTISNGGIYGSMLSTPILNPPQSGVLGMHNITERAIVKNGEVKIRPIMYLALSYDHRIVDGKEAVSFLKTIKECIEEPRRLFLDL